VRESSLLDRQEWANLVAARADHTDRCGNDQQCVVARQGKKDAGEQHQPGANDQHTPPTDAVSIGRDPQRDQGITDKRQCEKQADLCLAQPHLHQVEHEHDRQEAIGKQTYDACTKEQPSICC